MTPQQQRIIAAAMCATGLAYIGYNIVSEITTTFVNMLAKWDLYVTQKSCYFYIYKFKHTFALGLYK